MLSEAVHLLKNIFDLFQPCSDIPHITNFPALLCGLAPCGKPCEELLLLHLPSEKKKKRKENRSVLS